MKIDVDLDDVAKSVTIPLLAQSIIDYLYEFSSNEFMSGDEKIENTLINLEELIVVLAAHKIAYEKFIEASNRREKEGKPCIDSAT